MLPAAASSRVSASSSNNNNSSRPYNNINKPVPTPLPTSLNPAKWSPALIAWSTTTTIIQATTTAARVTAVAAKTTLSGFKCLLKTRECCTHTHSSTASHTATSFRMVRNRPLRHGWALSAARSFCSRLHQEQRRRSAFGMGTTSPIWLTPTTKSPKPGDDHSLLKSSQIRSLRHWIYHIACTRITSTSPHYCTYLYLLFTRFNHCCSKDGTHSGIRGCSLHSASLPAGVADALRRISRQRARRDSNEDMDLLTGRSDG